MHRAAARARRRLGPCPAPSVRPSFRPLARHLMRRTACTGGCRHSGIGHEPDCLHARPSRKLRRSCPRAAGARKRPGPMAAILPVNHDRRRRRAVGHSLGSTARRRGSRTGQAETGGLPAGLRRSVAPVDAGTSQGPPSRLAPPPCRCRHGHCSRTPCVRSIGPPPIVEQPQQRRHDRIERIADAPARTGRRTRYRDRCSPHAPPHPAAHHRELCDGIRGIQLWPAILMRPPA